MGAMRFPKDGNLLDQDRFISGFLRKHLRQVSEAGLTLLIMPGNDDLQAFDPLFNETCREFSHVYNPAQALIKFDGYEFIGMNYVCDYPFPLKDRCRVDDESLCLSLNLAPAFFPTRTRVGST